MTTRDVNAQIREKINSKIERVRRKLGDLPSETEITQQISEVKSALAQVESELNTESDLEQDVPSGLRVQLETQRERMLAQLERLELRKEMMTERHEQLQEVLEELKESFVRREFVQTPMAVQSPVIDSRRTQEERRKILEMVQSGKITADEAARLLDALRDQVQNAEKRRRRPRWVRIRVTDVDKNRICVNLTLPVGVVRAGLRAGGGLVGIDSLDTGKLEEMLDRGEIGYILDAHGENDNERVEIFIE